MGLCCGVHCVEGVVDEVELLLTCMLMSGRSVEEMIMQSTEIG